MAELSGLHIVFGYGGGNGHSRNSADLMNGIVSSETLAMTGTSTIKAPPSKNPEGQPVLKLRASVPGWYAIGSSPDASADPRDYITPEDGAVYLFCKGDDAVDWLPA